MGLSVAIPCPYTKSRFYARAPHGLAWLSIARRDGGAHVSPCRLCWACRRRDQRALVSAEPGTGALSVANGEDRGSGHGRLDHGYPRAHCGGSAEPEVEIGRAHV